VTMQYSVGISRAACRYWRSLSRCIETPDRDQAWQSLGVEMFLPVDSKPCICLFSICGFRDVVALHTILVSTRSVER
jgi:hypothetical protein